MSADLLYCDVGDRRFAFRSRDVWHVERAEHLRPGPRRDGRVGVLMIGKVTVEVFSLAAVLGVDDGRRLGPDGHIAVTGNSHGLFGWLADRIGRVDHPAAAHVAPLPSLIGSPASQWFEGAVRMDEHRSALLLRPQCINPVYPEAPQPRSEFLATPKPAYPFTSGAEPVAVIFKSSSLPPSAAARYALSGKQIAAIVQHGTAMPITGCADRIDGLTWWRRSIVPIVDFRPRGQRVNEPQERLLIARCGAPNHGALIGLSIAPEVLMCRAEGNYREMTEVPCPTFASGVFEINGEPVALVDLDRLLGSGARHGDAVLPDLLVERAARDAEPMSGPFDAPAFGA